MKDWKKVKLGTLLIESKVESTSPDPDKRISVKLNVKGVEKRPLTKDKKGATKYFVRKAGQFIYGKQNLHKGAFGLVPEELDGYESSSDIPAFDVDESCYPEWIYYFFKKGNFYLKLESLAKGVGSKRIHPHQIFDLDIFLPEKTEQKEILDQIATIESDHSALIDEIDYQEALLTQLRQSILQDAIQGKLTAEWRKQNPEVEPASELLKRIQAEKAQLIKEKKIKKEKPLPIIKKDEIPFEIPESWEWCRLGDIMLKVTDGTHHSPPNGPNGKFKYVTAKNIKNEGVHVSNITYVSEEVHNEIFNRCDPSFRDLLYIKDGATTGICCLNNLHEEFSMLSSVALIKYPSQIIGEFLLYLMRSKFYYDAMRADMSGVAITRVTLKKIKNSMIPVPPLDEQRALIKKTVHIMEYLNELETALKDHKNSSEKLLQSVLAEILGEENLRIEVPQKEKKITNIIREIKYDSKTTFMELVALLTKHGRLHAEDLWKMSKFPEDIDKFYAELKKQIEDKKSIKESTEKGYLELA